MFSFDASWDGFARTAVFECAGERREQLLVDDRCIVPWEILHAGAYLRVGVYGVSGNQTMPTVYSGQMFVARGAEPSEAAREHSADMFDQIVEIGDRAAQDAERAEESAEDAATSVTAAQNAKDAAIEALEAFRAPTATAQTLQPGTPATATYDGQNFTFGIPQGPKGDTPSLNAEFYPDYSVASVSNRAPHDCTFIGNDFVSFNKPEDGGEICYFNPSTWVRIIRQRHNFTESTGKGLQMKSVDYKYGKLLVGNGRAIASGETSYTDQGAKLYVFHNADTWKDASATITFSNCGDYDVVDVSALGYKIYGFWGGADGLVFVSCNLLNDVYLIQLESVNGRYNGNYSVINHWHQDGYFGEFAAHGGQVYNGSLYLAINDDTKCDVLKCILCDDGTLRFDVLHFGKKSGNTLDYHYLDGVCIKDGKLYAQPLYKGTNYSDVYSDVIVANIDDVGSVYPNGGVVGQVLTKTATGEEWQTPQGGGGGGGMETILDITLTEETDHIYVTTDADGNALSLDELHFDAYVVPTASNAAEAALSIRTNFNSAAKGGTNSALTRVFRPSGAKQFVGGTLYANACINGSLFGTQSDRAFPYVNADIFDTPLTALYLYGGVFGVGSRIVIKGRRA